ncbi:MAG: hypothetical protein ICV65_02175 [Flavisolibacter sp.]|nr:hypothetical protein [Flavisolibacter sp.]
MSFFDLHVHPSLKGGISRDTVQYNAWEEIGLFQVSSVILKKFLQILNSQSTLTQLKSSGTVAVATLTAIERAFAKNFIIYFILADPLVSPLSRRKLKRLRRDQSTYYNFFLSDLQQIEDAKGKNGGYNLVKKYTDIQHGQLNILFSIEGVHSLQAVLDETSDAAKAISIISNFNNLKDNTNYRFLFLTLAHLTRQPACVQCLGVRMKKLLDLFPEIDFLPDPEKIGFQPLGKEIITIAYDSQKSPAILIDIKHMSLVTRLQFNELRIQNNWTHIPIIASHMGVTGLSYKNLRIKDIIPGRDEKECDEIFWYCKNGFEGTKFNPWTICLYDEEIIIILESKGLIGISLDQRMIGEGEIYGEYMSKLEVKELQLHHFITEAVDESFTDPVSIEEDRALFTDFFKDEWIQNFLRERGIGLREDNTIDLENNKELQDLRYEILFDLDKVLGPFGVSHFDYLANNILHVIKVGILNGYDGTNDKADVRRSICIGSDLDGLIDAMNFPDWVHRLPVDEDNWTRADKYQLFKEELIYSIDTLKKMDPIMDSAISDTAGLVQDIMEQNALLFLQTNFT